MRQYSCVEHHCVSLISAEMSVTAATCAVVSNQSILLVLLVSILSVLTAEAFVFDLIKVCRRSDVYILNKTVAMQLFYYLRLTK